MILVCNNIGGLGHLIDERDISDISLSSIFIFIFYL